MQRKRIINESRIDFPGKKRHNRKVVAQLREKAREQQKVREAGVSLAALEGIKSVEETPTEVALPVRFENGDEEGNAEVRSVTLLVTAMQFGDYYLLLDNREKDDKRPVKEMEPFVYVIHRKTRLLCAAFRFGLEAKVFAWWIARKATEDEWPTDDSAGVPVELRSQLVDTANEVESWNLAGLRGMHGEVPDEEYDGTKVEVNTQPVQIVQTDPLSGEVSKKIPMPNGTFHPVPNNGNLYVFYERKDGQGYVVVEEPPNAASYEVISGEED